MLARHLPRNFINKLGLLRQLFADGNERHHDFESYLLALTFYLACSLENRAALHARDFRKQQPKPAAAKAQHRICFANLVHVMKQLSLLVELIE